MKNTRTRDTQGGRSMRPVLSTGAGRRTPEQPGPEGVPKKMMQIGYK